MKRLYKNIVFFLLPLVLMVLFFPINDRAKFVGLKNECFNHGIVLYDRIHHNSKPIDIVFLGSSHTINGINDSLIEKNLSTKKNVFNYGFCSLGQNIYFTLLKELIEVKKVETVVLEIREDEDRYSHKIFPFIADTKDVLFPAVLFNRDILDDYDKHFSYRVDLIQDRIFHQNEIPDFKYENYGFASGKDTAKVVFLDSIKVVRSRPDVTLTELERDFHLSYPRRYLDKLAQLCKEHNIKMYFLYIPSYGTVGNPKEYSTYKKYGEVILPPAKIFSKKENWYDEYHLNRAGAAELSLWLAKDIF